MVKRPICALSGLKPTAACPSVVQEYFFPEDLQEYDTHPDTFYQLVSTKKMVRLRSPTTGKLASYRLNLPPEYDEWLAKQQSSDINSASLQILFPREGDTFLMDNKNQRLAFKVSGSLQKEMVGEGDSTVDERDSTSLINRRTIEWRLNGQILKTGTSETLFWPVRPGQWQLEVKSENEVKQVTFEVRLGQPRAYPRGFSVRRDSKG